MLPLLDQVSSKASVPMADVFGSIVKGKAQIREPRFSMWG